jgi:hypothetical protein
MGLAHVGYEGTYGQFHVLNLLALKFELITSLRWLWKSHYMVPIDTSRIIPLVRVHMVLYLRLYSNG